MVGELVGDLYLRVYFGDFLMKFLETNINGVYLIEPKGFSDARGLFVKNFCQKQYAEAGLEFDFKENFYSVSRKNVIRGMHFQTPPHDTAKLVYVVAGEICDVALDLREDSLMYGKFISEKLSSKNLKSIYIPRGVAHGFSVLSEEAIVIYLQTKKYSPQNDAGIRFDSFGFEWEVVNPILSKRDENFIALKDFCSPFRLERGK